MVSFLQRRANALLLCWVLVLVGVSPVRAAIVNRTIDDTFGDSDTGRRVAYLPPDIWRDQSCAECGIKPDVQQTFKSTYHSATYTPAMGSISITLDFNGTSIWVYFILANNAGDNITTLTTLNFTMDGGPPEPFQHAPDLTTSNLQYNHLAYSRSGLPNTQHKLVISTSGDANAFVIFDYAIYTHDDEGQLSTDLQAASILQSDTSHPFPTAVIDNAKAENDQGSLPIPKSAIICIGVGGVVVLTILIFSILYCVRRREQAQEAKATAPTNPSMAERSAGNPDLARFVDQQHIDPIQARQIYILAAEQFAQDQERQTELARQTMYSTSPSLHTDTATLRGASNRSIHAGDDDRQTVYDHRNTLYGSDRTTVYGSNFNHSSTSVQDPSRSQNSLHSAHQVPPPPPVTNASMDDVIYGAYPPAVPPMPVRSRSRSNTVTTERSQVQIPQRRPTLRSTAADEHAASLRTSMYFDEISPTTTRASYYAPAAPSSSGHDNESVVPAHLAAAMAPLPSNSPSPPAGMTREEVRRLRQMELDERLRTVQREVSRLSADLTNEKGQRGSGMYRRRISNQALLLTSQLPQSQGPSRGSLLGPGTSTGIVIAGGPPGMIDEEVEVELTMDEMKEQLRLMKTQIQYLREQQLSAWALGLSDDPPPGYTPALSARPVSPPTQNRTHTALPEVQALRVSPRPQPAFS